MIVVDTNVVASLLLPTEASDAAERLFAEDPHWLVPLLWRSELRNVLATAVRNGVLELGHAVEVMAFAESLLEGAEVEVESSQVLHLASESGCTAYDCEFVALARDHGVPLYTLDRKLLKAFPAETREMR